MAAVSLTHTPEAKLQKSYSFNSAVARGLKFEIGSIAGDGGTYSVGGVSWTPKSMAAGDVKYISFTPVGADAGGRVYSYDNANGKIQIYEAGADAAALDELGAADTWSETIQYIAIGV